MSSRSVFLLILLLSFLLPTMTCADIYQWVDENGKTHFSDNVPLKYQQDANKLDAIAPPTHQQKAEAEDVASRTQALAKEYDIRHYEKNSVKLKQAAGNESLSQKNEPKPGSCAAKLKAYHASSSCFNRYRNANGSLKAEAYEKCTDVSSPEECL